MVNKVLDGILGLCVADACGVPVEFSLRSERKQKPVKGMTGYGTYYKPPGTWSDDSSMTLATMHSLCQGLDYEDLMKHFKDWYEDGKYTADQEVFDIGNVTRKAIRAYDGKKKAYECGLFRESDNGNGSLMRILPFAFYLKSTFTDGIYLTEEGFDIVHKASCITHAHPISQIACGIYVSIAMVLCDAQPGISIQEAVRAAFRFYRNKKGYIGWIERFSRIEDLSELALTTENDIRSSSYVVDTLEAALWCFLTTDGYEDCVLKAVNLGEDTDTVAAVAGGLAGLKYGAKAIPQEWKAVLARRNDIEELCRTFHARCLRRDVQRFSTFLLYFEEKKGRDLCVWKGAEPVTRDVYQFSYPAYDAQVYELMENVLPHSMFVDPDYQKTLKERGYETLEEAMENLSQADLEMVMAMFTAISRRERSEHGYWNAVFKSGKLYLLVKRLFRLVNPVPIVRTFYE